MSYFVMRMRLALRTTLDTINIDRSFYFCYFPLSFLIWSTASYTCSKIHQSFKHFTGHTISKPLSDKVSQHISLLLCEIDSYYAELWGISNHTITFFFFRKDKGTLCFFDVRFCILLSIHEKPTIWYHFCNTY